MKLLTIPAYTQESVEFNFLGCSVTMPFKGRKVWKDVEVDFEKRDALAECLIHEGKPTRNDMELWVRYKETNHSFVLRNPWPYRHLRANVWLCSVSHACSGYEWSW